LRGFIVGAKVQTVERLPRLSWEALAGGSHVVARCRQ
jgi:hypothetical protein